MKQAKSKDVNEFEALCSIAAQRLEFPMTAASVSDAHKELLREQERKVNAGGVVSPAGKVLSKAYGAAWLVVRRKGANDPQDLQVATSAYIARKKRSTIDSAIRAAATLDDAAARTIERNVASIASRLPFPLTAERAEELLETQPFSNPKSAPLLEAYVACAIRFCGDAVDEASLITHLETYRNGESK